MSLSPSNPTIFNSATQEFTSLINNAIWSIPSGAGSLSAGSNSYKKIFTPSGNGVSTVTAKSGIWGTETDWSGWSSGCFSKSGDTVTCTADYAGILWAQTIDLLHATGEEVIFTVPNPLRNAPNTYFDIGSNNEGKRIRINGNDVIGFDNSSQGTLSGSWGAGSVFKFKLKSDKTIEIYIDNTLRFTTTGTQGTFTNPASNPLFFRFLWALPIAGDVLPVPTTDSTLLTTESTTITVTDPTGGERVYSQII